MPTKHGPYELYIETVNIGEPEESPDMVNHPPHYQSENGLEVIDVIEAFTADLQGIEAVCTANVLKYACRWFHKNGVEDLEKAKWYLTKLIEIRKEKEQHESASDC